jgi:hypothetical protein
MPRIILTKIEGDLQSRALAYSIGGLKSVVKMLNLTGHVGIHGRERPDRNERTVPVR